MTLLQKPGASPAFLLPAAFPYVNIVMACAMRSHGAPRRQGRVLVFSKKTIFFVTSTKKCDAHHISSVF
jgi:hypothetical protein